MDIKNKIIQMIQKEDTDLPTLPVIVNNIIKAAGEPNTTTEDLARIITYDQGMTNKLLKLANSIYYAQKTRVNTIKRAITVIGFDEIMGIAMGMSVLTAFTDKNEGIPLDIKALWIHTIGCATAAKDLANRTNPAIAKKIFIPGLLHDMGKVLLSVHFKSEYQAIRGRALEKKIPLFRAEQQELGLDHAMLAGLLMKRWNFPNTILYPCRFHHNPDASPTEFRHQSLILNLANYICHKANIGHSGNQVPVTVPNAIQKCGTNEASIRLIVDSLRKKETQIKDFFKITT